MKPSQTYSCSLRIRADAAWLDDNVASNSSTARSPRSASYPQDDYDEADGADYREDGGIRSVEAAAGSCCSSRCLPAFRRDDGGALDGVVEAVLPYKMSRHGNSRRMGEVGLEGTREDLRFYHH